MLLLPLDDDSLLFRLSLYYGLLVMLLEIFTPLLFQRRVRIEIPRLALLAPVAPLPTREFQRRRLELQQQVSALQRAIAGTPSRSSQKRPRKKMGFSAAGTRPMVSPTASTSPASSIKATRPKMSQQSEEIKRIINKVRVNESGGDRSRMWREKEISQPFPDAESMHETRQSPMAMSNALTTCAVQRGGFSFSEVFEKSGTHGDEDFVTERLVGIRAANMETQRQKESSEKIVKHFPLHEPESTIRFITQQSEDEDTEEGKMAVERSSVSLSSQSDECKTLKNTEDKNEFKQSKPLTDFEAFCASFAAGGSAAAQQAVAKRKYHTAFEVDNTQANDTSSNKHKRSRTFEQDTKQPSGDNTTETMHGADKRTHCEASGPADEINKALSPHEILEKRKYDEAFGTIIDQEQEKDKTPRIARRISFDGEVEYLGNTPSKEMAMISSSEKGKQKQPLGMVEDEDEDFEWRDALSFRPYRFDL